MRTSWKAVLTALMLVGGATTMSACANAQTYGYGNGTYGNGYGDPGYSDPNADPYAQPDGDPNAYPPDPGYGPADNGYADNGYDYGYGYQPEDGVNFSYDSGGYCDAYGCPDDYWDMPVYYGPVFFGGSWYDGPALLSRLVWPASVLDPWRLA